MRQQSHGQITGFEVTLWNNKEYLQHIQISRDTNSIPVNLTQMASFSDDDEIMAAVIAKNVEGVSQPASVPLRLIGMCKRCEWDVFCILKGILKKMKTQFIIL